jgi:hypothetical protein
LKNLRNAKAFHRKAFWLFLLRKSQDLLGLRFLNLTGSEKALGKKPFRQPQAKHCFAGFANLWVCSVLPKGCLGKKEAFLPKKKALPKDRYNNGFGG